MNKGWDGWIPFLCRKRRYGFRDDSLVRRLRATLDVEGEEHRQAEWMKVKKNYNKAG